MKELLDALKQATNVKLAIYDNATDKWTLIFHKGEPNEIESSALIHFLLYA